MTKPLPTPVGESFMLTRWREIDTSGAKNMTDERLLEAIAGMPLGNGWGLIAELMKRFDQRRDNG